MKKLQKTLPGKPEPMTETNNGPLTFENVFDYCWLVEDMTPMESSRYATLICCDWPERYQQAVVRLLDKKPIEQFTAREIPLKNAKEVFRLQSDLKALEMLLILEKNPMAWRAIRDHDIM